MARGQLADGHALRVGVADDLVVDVGDVHHPGDRVALPGEVTAQQVGEDEAAEVADVGRARRRSGRSCTCGRGPVRAAGTPRARRPSVLRKRRLIRRTIRRGRRADDAAGALGARQVAGRGLHRDGARVEPEQAARPSRMRSSRRRRGAAALRGSSRRREPGRQPALGEPLDDARQQLAGCRCRAWPGRRPGTAGPGRRSRAAPSSASQSGMEHRVAVGMPVQPGRLGHLDAAQPQAVLRPERDGCRCPRP